MCVVSIAALITLAPMARRPFQKGLWKPHHWLVVTHVLFFAGAITLRVVRPNPDPYREGDPAALRLLWTLWWGSLASCVFWIWRMKGFRCGHAPSRRSCRAGDGRVVRRRNVRHGDWL